MSKKLKQNSYSMTQFFPKEAYIHRHINFRNHFDKV